VRIDYLHSDVCICTYRLTFIGRIIMRNKIAVVAAASAPLILSAAGAFASEPQFRTPSTDRARETQSLLARAAQAVNASAPRTGEEHISNLWLYPTADEDMVFAQYVVTTNKASVAASQQHFELLKMKGDRIVEQRDLTRAGDDSALPAKRSSDVRDWSASIGNGHTTSTTVTSATSEGTPASPHWSASIGTGQVTDDSTRRLQVASNLPPSHAPGAHWTSKIGTAHAVDSNTSAQNGNSPS
jgi:hypothetical protein